MKFCDWLAMLFPSAAPVTSCMGRLRCAPSLLRCEKSIDRQAISAWHAAHSVVRPLITQGPKLFVRSPAIHPSNMLVDTSGRCGPGQARSCRPRPLTSEADDPIESQLDHVAGLADYCTHRDQSLGCEAAVSMGKHRRWGMGGPLPLQ